MKRIDWNLVVDHIPVCIKIIKEYKPFPPNISIDDLLWGPCIDTLIRCSKSWKSNKGSKFSTYIWISVNRSIKSFLGKRTREPVYQVESTFDNDLIQTSIRIDMYSLLNKLDLADRIILIMRYWKGMTFREIAVELKSSAATVCVKEKSILKKCREIYNIG